MVAAAVVMGVALWLAQRELFATELHGVERFAALAILVAVGLLSYGVAAAVLGAGDWRALARMVAQRRQRRQAPGTVQRQ